MFNLFSLKYHRAFKKNLRWYYHRRLLTNYFNLKHKSFLFYKDHFPGLTVCATLHFVQDNPSHTKLGFADLEGM